MRNRTIGILAHVDAGKTTLSEQILFRTGAVRALGRVDRGDTALDTDPVERERGITVFSDQAAFEHVGRQYTLIDTPGHVDFAAETERALVALDAAVLLVDSSDGVRSHAALLARMARRRGVPTLLFLNKCDLVSSDPERALAQAAQRLETPLVPLPADPERVAELDETFLERYLEGNWSEADCRAALSRAFLACEDMPVLKGSALTGAGVDELLDALDMLLQEQEPAGDADSPLEAQVYKIRRDPKGARVTFVKMRSGRLIPRDSFSFGDRVEKIHEIRVYRGSRWSCVEEALPGDAVGLTGLSEPKCGDILCLKNGKRIREEGDPLETQPALAARVTADGTPDSMLLEKLRILEDEDGQLGVTCRQELGEILVRVMGPVQLEILQSILYARFGIRACFSPPCVLYRETIAAPVMGYGHYEPLRHYAEVNLRLEPAPRGSGLSFASECHVDDLAVNYQNLIRTHVFERAHRGVLTGAELTDVRVVLVAGRAHEKHTEGGDFREATYRAIRQGLMNAQSVLLEPYYRFEMLVPSGCAGRVMSDLPALACEFEPPETLGEDVCIRGRGPVATLADYGVALRAMTHGEGSAAFMVDGDERCHDAERVIVETGYDPNADLKQPASSVFCAHGAGFVVPWNEAEGYMHCPGMK